MKLLLDANLSPALVASLANLYPGSTHVFQIGDIAEDDAAIWETARRSGYVIVSKDSDFLELSLLRGAPPKVVLLRVGNVPTSQIEALLRKQRDRVHQFAADADEAILIIDGGDVGQRAR